MQVRYQAALRPEIWCGILITFLETKKGQTQFIINKYESAPFIYLELNCEDF